MSQQPRIISKEELPASEAKWVTLQKIRWQDHEGVQRVWESAERKTRKSSGVDAVAILALIRSETGAFPLSTVIIEQYRPPVGKYIVELPAGLMDDGETPEQTAIRELQEETGYIADEVIETSPILVADPGMSNANMKFVTLSVKCPDILPVPLQRLDDGEAITVKVVELRKLHETLKEYTEKDFLVDAKLSHFAAGYDMAQKLGLS